MSSNSLSDLKKKTQEFFDRHWPSSWGPAPTWSDHWCLKGSMPNHNSQGVYALLDEADNVLYIGVGAALRGGDYEGHGLGGRTAKYTHVAPNQQGKDVQYEREYVMAEPWDTRGVRAFVTIALACKDSKKQKEVEPAYLSYGLEAFLLGDIKPPFNKNCPTRKPPVK